MRRVFFVRHGLSQSNVDGRYSGHIETPLTTRGRGQAVEAGKWARDNGLVFDIVLSSPLSRAHDTAKHISSEVRYNHDDIVLIDALKERHFGALEDQPSSASKITREQYENNPFILDHIENIETFSDLQYRANQFKEYLDTLPHETILIVSHGAIGRAIERSLKNLPLTEFGTKFGNAQIIQLI